MNQIAVEISIVFGLILLNGLFAMAEIALVSSRKAKLQQRANAGDSKARIALLIKESPGDFLSTVQIGITLIGVLAGAYGGATIAQQLTPVFRDIPLLASNAEGFAVGIVVLCITFGSLILGELVPKRYALSNPEGLAGLVAAPMALLSKVVHPFVWILDRSSRFVMRLLRFREVSESPVTEEEIRILIGQGTQAGILDEVERQILERVFRLGDRKAVSVMTPRTEMVWLDMEDTIEINRRKIAEAGFSSYPVCRDGIENVLGLIDARSLLFSGGMDAAIPAEMIKPPIFVPETTPALHMLELFKKKGLRKAFIVDEYGGVLGIATLTDIMEAMVGDMGPEDGVGQPAVSRQPDGSFLLDGMLPVDELRDVLEVQFLPGDESGDFNTLGGFLMTQLGRIPVMGDRYEWAGFEFRIVSMDGHRVDSVSVIPVPGDLDRGVPHTTV